MKIYISPLCKEIKVVSKMTELQSASPMGSPYLPVATGGGDIIAE